MDGRMYGQPKCSMPPAGQGRRTIKTLELKMMDDLSGFKG